MFYKFSKMLFLLIFLITSYSLMSYPPTLQDEQEVFSNKLSLKDTSKKTKIAIYLSGKIPKKDEKNNPDLYWADQHILYLQSLLGDHDIVFLNPVNIEKGLVDSYEIFGRDMLQVYSSHFVLVDARDNRGIGVGAEMMWAKTNKIPVITWVPKNTRYNKLVDPKQNLYFVHPFVSTLSDELVEDLDGCALAIKKYLENPTHHPIKGLEDIQASMQCYKDKKMDALKLQLLDVE